MARVNLVDPATTSTSVKPTLEQIKGDRVLGFPNVAEGH